MQTVIIISFLKVAVLASKTCGMIVTCEAVVNAGSTGDWAAGCEAIQAR